MRPLAKSRFFFDPPDGFALAAEVRLEIYHYMVIGQYTDCGFERDHLVDLFVPLTQPDNPPTSLMESPRPLACVKSFSLRFSKEWSFPSRQASP